MRIVSSAAFRILHSGCPAHILQMSEIVRSALCVLICPEHGERPRYQEATGSPGDYAIRIDACCEELLDRVAAMLGQAWPAQPMMSRAIGQTVTGL